MLPSGIFVRIELDDLASSLPARLINCGPSRLTVATEPKSTGSGVQADLKVGQWSDNWCFIEVSGAGELAALVLESLVESDPLGDVLSWHYRSEVREYSYALFRDGLLQETFESRGPSMETVNFTSELRKIPLQSLLRPAEFMNEAADYFGIDPVSEVMSEVERIVFYLNLPEKRSFWQVLLGAVSSK